MVQTGLDTKRQASERPWPTRFWLTMALVSLFTLLYPIGLFSTLPREQAINFFRNDLAWSFHSLFLIPVAFALMALAFRPQFYLQLPLYTKLLGVIIFLVGFVPLYFAVVDDAQVIPTPDRLTSVDDVQAKAIKIDQCMRDENCAARNNYIKLIPDCRSKYSSKYKVLDTGKLPLGNERAEILASFEKAQAYFCALLDVTNDNINPGFLGKIIFMLKIVLAMGVWSFVFYTLFLAITQFRSIDKKSLYALVGAFIVFLVWFPCQLYAEWYYWYGDFSHVLYYNPAFKGFIPVAVLLLVLFTVWTLVLVANANIVATIAGVNAVVVGALTTLFLFSPVFVKKLFSGFSTIDNSIAFLWLLIFLMLVIVYIRSLVLFGAQEDSKGPSRP